jgi:hypothetical protein
MQMRNLRREVFLEFWPAPEEANDARTYGGAFHSTIKELITSHENLWHRCNDAEDRKLSPSIRLYTGEGMENGRQIRRMIPPEMAELLLTLGGGGGLATALYKLLKLWVEDRKGRRIKLKVGNHELEATNLNPKQFAKLMNQIKESAPGEENGLRERLAEQGLPDLVPRNREAFETVQTLSEGDAEGDR